MSCRSNPQSFLLVAGQMSKRNNAQSGQDVSLYSVEAFGSLQRPSDNVVI